MSKFHLIKSESISNEGGRWITETERCLFICQEDVPLALKELVGNEATHFRRLHLEQGLERAERALKKSREEVETLRAAIEFLDAADKLKEAQDLADAIGAGSKSKSKSL